MRPNPKTIPHRILAFVVEGLFHPAGLRVVPEAWLAAKESEAAIERANYEDAMRALKSEKADHAKTHIDLVTVRGEFDAYRFRNPASGKVPIPHIGHDRTTIAETPRSQQKGNTFEYGSGFVDTMGADIRGRDRAVEAFRRVEARARD